MRVTILGAMMLATPFIADVAPSCGSRPEPPIREQATPATPAAPAADDAPTPKTPAQKTPAQKTPAQKTPAQKTQVEPAPESKP